MINISTSLAFLVLPFSTKFFQDNGIKCLEPEGLFFVFPELNIDDIAFTKYMLNNYGVEVVSGSGFGPAGRGHIRINCATSIERLDEGLERILKANQASRSQFCLE